MTEKKGRDKQTGIDTGGSERKRWKGEGREEAAISEPGYAYGILHPIFKISFGSLRKEIINDNHGVRKTFRQAKVISRSFARI